MTEVDLSATEINLDPEVAEADLGETSNTASGVRVQELVKRNAGVSVFDCAIAMVAVSGRAQGIGQLFGCLVVGMARNPSMREDLVTYTNIGMVFLELLAIVVILIAGMLLYSGQARI